MAFYIELKKFDETENFATYVYEFRLVTERVKNKAGKWRNNSKLVNGKIKINKKTGSIDVIKIAEGDQGSYSQRAILAIAKLWEKGEFPDKTCWAS